MIISGKKSCILIDKQHAPSLNAENYVLADNLPRKDNSGRN